MGLVFWWLPLIWLALIGGYAYYRYIHKLSNVTTKVARLVAHSSRLAELPEYKRALKQYRRILFVAVGVVSLSILSGIILTARPVSVTVVSPAQKNRDIMLCLDVSGSMVDADQKIIDQFSVLAKSFDGQRIGLTIFNSNPLVILPLTDDQELINAQLANAKTGLQNVKSRKSYDFTTGTTAGFSRGTSLIGDGFASCVSHLGTNTNHRSQSVILATDNEAGGTSIVSMPQGAALAKQNNIRMYAIDPGQFTNGYGETVKDHQELKTLALLTGGNYFNTNDNQSIPDIISAISSQEATYFVGGARLAQSDTPLVAITIVIVTFAILLIIAWRYNL